MPSVRYLSSLNQVMRMGNSSAPVFIIVGTIVALLGISIASSLTNSFVSSGDQQNDIEQFGDFVNFIENECDRMDEYNRFSIASSQGLELRNAGIDIEDREAIYNPEGEANPQSIDCQPEIDLGFELPETSSESDIPPGDYTVRISGQNEGELKIEVS